MIPTSPQSATTQHDGGLNRDRSGVAAKRQKHKWSNTRNPSLFSASTKMHVAHWFPVECKRHEERMPIEHLKSRLQDAGRESAPSFNFHFSSVQ